MKWCFAINMKIRKLFHAENKQQFNTYCFYGEWTETKLTLTTFILEIVENSFHP